MVPAKFLPWGLLGIFGLGNLRFKLIKRKKEELIPPLGEPPQT